MLIAKVGVMYKQVPVLTLEEVSLVTKTALEVVIYFN